jgi:hypothetical protein
MTLALLLLAVGNLMLLLSIRSLRTGRLRERHALLFAAVGVPFLILAMWPDAVGFLARRLGIEYPTVLLIAVTTFFLMVNFSLLSAVSVLERRVVTLAQTVAILEERLDGAARAGAERDGPIVLAGDERERIETLKRSA